MNTYKLRVDWPNGQLPSVLYFNSESFAICKEGGIENPHYHLFLKTHMKMPAMRATLRKHNLRGNASYSLKKIDEEWPVEYLAYMMKEGDFTYTNIPEDIVEQFTEYDKKVKQQIADKKKRKQPVWKAIMLLCEGETTFPAF